MHPALTATYLLPAILLNPVLFLHSVNTILSRLLPPIAAASSIYAPYSTLGPSANHPHLDIHASDNLCWSYTAVMVCAQLVAFGSVSQAREEGRERKARKKEGDERRKRLKTSEHNGTYVGHLVENGNGVYAKDDDLRLLMKCDSDGTPSEGSPSDDTEDEIIL